MYCLKVLIFHSKYMPDLRLMINVVKYKKVVLFEWVHEDTARDEMAL